MSTYYVGPGGNDANAGTSWALRKLTLNGAEDIPVSAGDTVYVGGGTYRESLTVDVSGTAGNPITYIGDYTGANTSGTKGVVRITGSADDIALTRASCITGSSKNYRTFRGFALDLSSAAPISFTGCDHWIIEQMSIDSDSVPGSALGAIDGTHTNTNHIIRNCFIKSLGSGVKFGNTAADDRGHAIQSCVILLGAGAFSYGVLAQGSGGITVSNCYIHGATIAGLRSLSLNTGQTLTAYNNIIVGCSTALLSDATAKFVEDYNTLFQNATARTNVTAGANSVTRPPLFDTRWFFEMVNGGRLVTPFDLASYSTLVEYNSGTGAPSTDMRGASVVGTYREWGALEYSANYRAQGPVSIAPIGGIG